MATALPRAIRLRLDQALAQWPHWDLQPAPGSPPRVLQPLGQGLSNHSFLLEAGARRFVLRLDGLNPHAYGLNRQTEWRILHNACAAGLAPRPRYCNPELGALVCDYLAPDPATAEDPVAVAALLRAIHRLPAVHARLDLSERCRRHEHTLRAAAGAGWHALAALAEPLALLLEQAETLAGPLLLCHNDLLRSNRLHSGGRLWAVDWEYAAMGSAWFDLAAVQAGDEMPEADSRALLQAYLGREPQPQQLHTLALFDCIYRYLELLWYAQRENNVNTGFWRGKLDRLQQRLQY
ncbi:choline/ethanolamine kinase family protein [Kineobactrum salinum]|uniref:Phosphotransferase family protein n=1 Tax=Kineobactrum salinum TaxID=2708301 RepID=A0A6C0U5F4_9GAMM|nr:choline/ethanolamine kinase family protein [Kineobactrum salinum]QIB66649.1 phosphotransferase family protein [Kineobactrum salinum]